MLENIIEAIIVNFKKYLYALIGLIGGILFIEYGFFKALFVVILAFIGFKLGDSSFQEKALNKIYEMLDRMKRILEKKD